MPAVDWRAVGAGGVVALVIGVPAMLAFRVADAIADFGCESNWLFPFYAVVLAGWVAGGRVAALRQLSAPFTHAILAALASLAVVVPIGLLVRVAAGDGDSCEINPVASVVFNAMVASSAGILGAMLAGRAPRSSTRREL